LENLLILPVYRACLTAFFAEILPERMDKPIMGWGWQLLVQFHECTKAERWLHRKTGVTSIGIEISPR
jgi:hypothetical protein